MTEKHKYETYCPPGYAALATRKTLYGSIGKPASIKASKPPNTGLTLVKPSFNISNAARALEFSAGQVQ